MSHDPRPPPWLEVALGAAGLTATSHPGVWSLGQASGRSGLAVWRELEGGGELAVLSSASVRLAWGPELAHVALAEARTRVEGVASGAPPELGELSSTLGPVAARFGLGESFGLLAHERVTLGLEGSRGELSLEWRRWPASLTTRLARGGELVFEHEEPAVVWSERDGVHVWPVPRAAFFGARALSLEAALEQTLGAVADVPPGVLDLLDVPARVTPEVPGLAHELPARELSVVARALGAEHVLATSLDELTVATSARGGFVVTRRPTHDELGGGPRERDAWVVELFARPTLWARWTARAEGAVRGLVEEALSSEARAWPARDEAPLARAFDPPLARLGFARRLVRARYGDVSLRYLEPRARRVCELSSSTLDGALSVLVATYAGPPPLAVVTSRGGAPALADGVTLEHAASLRAPEPPHELGAERLDEWLTQAAAELEQVLARPS